jgi:hypothetical protein
LDSGITSPPNVCTGVSAKDITLESNTCIVTMSVRLQQSRDLNPLYKRYHDVGAEFFDKMMLIDVLRYLSNKAMNIASAHVLRAIQIFCMYKRNIGFTACVHLSTTQVSSTKQIH